MNSTNADGELQASLFSNHISSPARAPYWVSIIKNSKGLLLLLIAHSNKKVNQNFLTSLLQDTVVAVEALAKYAARTFSHATNLVVTIDTPVSATQIAIKPTSRLLAQRKAVPIPAGLQFLITGTGCALIQVTSGWS